MMRTLHSRLTLLHRSDIGVNCFLLLSGRYVVPLTNLHLIGNARVRWAVICTPLLQASAHAQW